MLMPERMCCVCFTSLNPRLDLNTGAMSYIHPHRSEPWDHQPDPVPIDERLIPICDLCAQPGGAVTFHTRRTVVIDEGPGGDLRDMGDYWSACTRCAVHIRKRSLHLLLNRAVLVWPEPLNRPGRENLRRNLKAFHFKFFAADPQELSTDKGND
ncbi:hypothetical protein [Streptomyces sp. NPDC014733]|uniref:hypothetical protein n=1 Tax=Streptomyces sp. NPDC014733 TaxID=3364885 RepID=UPI0037017B7A